MKTKTVSVIGLGYIGLPTAALLASHEYSVFGVDVNEHTVKTINQGEIHIVEPDLDVFVRSAVAAGRLQAFTEPQAADVYMICVPTPLHEGRAIPQPDISCVLTATRSIAGLMKAGDLVILESTSPVGTTEQMQTVFRDAGVDVDDVHIAYCPERVLPGKIMTELAENDRVVGGLTSVATQAATEFYQSFVHGAVLQTDARTAEMCKLTENSFRDVNIAFANELSLICDKEGINVWDLIALSNRHPRVDILQPGTGVGGHCIAVDPWFIVARDEVNTRLIRTARDVNNHKTEWVIDKIKLAVADASACKGKKPKIACLGLAFKPDIDDLRESPALEVVETLLEQGFDLLVVEPNIESHASLPLSPLEAAIEQADVIAVLVKHREFTQPDVRAKLFELSALDFVGL